MSPIAGILKEGVIIPQSLPNTKERKVFILFPQKSRPGKVSKIAKKTKNKLTHSMIEEIIQSVEYEEDK
ncbi:MAG: hypothetical protein V2A53_04630 [bacterium]